MPTKDAILEALKVVIDPELHRNIVELGMVRNIEILDRGAVNVTRWQRRSLSSDVDGEYRRERHFGRARGAPK